MRKSAWKLVLVAVVVIFGFFVLGYIQASDGKPQDVKKAEMTSNTPVHQAGAAACIEAHKTGKCVGHDAGKCGGTCICNGSRKCGRHDAKKN